MSLENELNTRLDRSLKELEDVTVSLQHVKRLADTQHASTEHLSNITNAMIGVATQLNAVLASVGQSGSALQSAADLLKTVDVKAGLSQIDLELKASSLDLQAVRQEIQSLRLQSDLAVQQGEHNQTELTNLSNAVNGSISNAEASRSSLAASFIQIDLELKASSRDLQAVRQEIQSLRLQSDLAVQQGEHNKTELTNLSNTVNRSISNAEASRSSLAASVLQLETFVSDKFSGLSNALQALEKRGRISILGTCLLVILSAAAVLYKLARLPQ